MVVNSLTLEELEDRLAILFKAREPFFKRADLEIKGNPSVKEFNETIMAAFA
jgi:hypothetical protein